MQSFIDLFELGTFFIRRPGLLLSGQALLKLANTLLTESNSSRNEILPIVSLQSSPESDDSEMASFRDEVERRLVGPGDMACQKNVQLRLNN